MNFRIIRRALISVSDKKGIVDFAQKLGRWNIELISTGGTLRALRDAGIKARSVSDITGFPEVLDGRVKTLHPVIHAGILGVTDNPAHRRQMDELRIEPIDMVVVNLYPFEETISRKDVSPDEAIEEIDIGGPAMIRAAAKNFHEKAVITNPDQYQTIIDEMAMNGGAISEDTRLALAQEVFCRTAQYDNTIAEYLHTMKAGSEGFALPETLSLFYRKSQDLRYGENPHQVAALYGGFQKYFEKLHGKELSYNNIVDIQAATDLVAEFSEPAVVIIKHTNPCGAGTARTLSEAYTKALSTDPKSAFGGIVAVNRPLDSEAAKAIDGTFTEVIVAPAYTDGVLDFLRHKKDRRLILHHGPVNGGGRKLQIKPVAAGLLVQTADDLRLDPAGIKVVTRRAPTAEEHSAMLFGWIVATHVKSNAIVYARGDRTLGIGAGQMSRVDSSRIAVLKAQDTGLSLQGSAVASDAFFPFADGLLEAVKAGATAVIQPGGSVRDPEVIRAADDNDIAMVFTGIRHFKH